MTEISKFWDIGPHEPVPVEETWHEFVRFSNGQVVADLLSLSPKFENADYFFTDSNVVAELKEIKTEFLETQALRKGFEQLLERIVHENPEWRPSLLGGDGQYPKWFTHEFVRLARPPISRILKKANRQIRDTKKHFGVSTSTGVLFFVNDGFTGFAPDIVCAIACDLLLHSYSSIDCFVYLTVNRYVALPNSNEPKLIWIPVYSDRTDDGLVNFINTLGRYWCDFLESKIGPFTSRNETQDSSIIRGSKAIIIPNGVSYRSPVGRNKLC